MSESKAGRGGGGLLEMTQDDYGRTRMLEDLHLAAELGKTLLDRNKELENLLKDRHTTIEDQKLEIEYLTKQTVALKEVNDSRLRIYEQLEVSIQDLERTNHRLQFENSSEKKHVKSLNATIEQLESKCEELHSTIDELRIQVDVLKRKSIRTNENELTKNNLQKDTTTIRNRCESVEDVFMADFLPDVQLEKTTCTTKSSNKIESKVSSSPCAITTEQQSVQTDDQEFKYETKQSVDEIDNGMEEMVQLLAQLRESRTQCNRNERIIAELEEQLSTIVKQNQALENQVIQLSHREDDMKSMHDEFNTLDEVRQGQMCSKCLRKIDQTDSEMAADDDDDDDQSLLDELMTTQHRSSFSIDIQDNSNTHRSSPLPAVQEIDNPYKVLVEKYEALVEVHRHPIKPIKTERQDELNISGDFLCSTASSATAGGTVNTKDTDEESGHGSSGMHHPSKQYKNTRSKTFSTPTDFSEAETSSSGFSDEISHKATQTEGQIGSFLCTIADGEDCKFSIYDDASPLDSRFRDRPEYRDLFKEIFRVLKKAAENKAEGEELPLLDEKSKNFSAGPLAAAAAAVAAIMPTTTMAACHLPEFIDDDSQSIISSTMSEFSIQNEPTTIIENIIQSQNPLVPETEACSTTTTTTTSGADGNTATSAAISSSGSTKPEYVLKPLVRPPLAEYLSVEVRKRSSSKRKNRQQVERSDSPMTHIIGSPKITYSNRPGSSRKRKDHTKSSNTASTTDENMWNGHTLQFWSTASAPSPTPSQCSGKGYVEFKPSSASQDLHKLKKLDMSYAEVLRNADNKKKQLYRQRRRHIL